MKINLIVATDEKNGIWKAWILPWKLSNDMRYFKKITSETTDLSKHNAVIMWRNTRLSIPGKFRPLEDRINCILTRNIKKDDIWSKIDDFVIYFNSIEHCLMELKSKENVENIFIIGWANIYNQFLNNDLIDSIYITKIKWDFNCDVFLDEIDNKFVLDSTSESMTENNIEYNFCKYKKVD